MPRATYAQSAYVMSALECHLAPSMRPMTFLKKQKKICEDEKMIFFKQ